MSLVEHLHDDDLLERARAGTLTNELRERLNAHCKACEACAMEVRWIEDGLQRILPTSEDVDAGLRAVDAVLGRALQSQAHGRSERVRPEPCDGPAQRRASRGRWRWMLNAAAVLALCLVSTGALAAVWNGVVRVGEIWMHEVASRPTERGDGRPPVHPHTTPRAVSTARPQAPEGQGESAAANPPKSVPAPPEARADVDHSLAPAATPALPKLDRNARAEKLLRLANRARNRGDYHAALAGYRAAAGRFTDLSAGEVAILSMARLLQHRLGDPRRALSAYRRYLALRSSPPLLEEARLGVAQCTWRMGDNPAERRAWQDLLAHHPETLHAHEARQRLALLERAPEAAPAPGAAVE